MRLQINIHTAIRVIRVFVGLVAAWQALGLLPVLTTWLPNLHRVTGGMLAIAIIKFLAMFLCGGVYFWLGKFKKRFDNEGGGVSDSRIVMFSILAALGFGAILVIAIPVFSYVRDTAKTVVPEYPMPPTFESEGWTQESTGSDVAGPWLAHDPPGTRYSRMADGMIHRLFPPGVRPEAQKANPFALGESTDRPPSN